MKRRTNSSRSLRPRAVSPPSFNPSWSSEKIHRVVWNYLEACSDADGWLFFQTVLFPAMAIPADVSLMSDWESIYLANRDLIVVPLNSQMVLLKCGVPIAGCDLSLYDAARGCLEDVCPLD